MADIIADTKTKMNAALDHFKQELRNLRAGRASPSLIEPISIEVYGAQMKIKDVATIATPEPRQLLITPFDAQNAQQIASAIQKSNLGLNPILEGKAVRVIFPELDANRRKDLINQCHKKKEDCKIAIRNIRRDQNEALKKQKSSGTLPEDDIKRLEKQIQEITDKFCLEADNASGAKEKEISTV